MNTDGRSGHKKHLNLYRLGRACAAVLCLSGAAHAQTPPLPQEPSAEWPVVFDLRGLGDSPMGQQLADIWPRTPALIAQTLELRLLDGATAASLAAKATQAGMRCNAAGTQCDYSGLVRARILPGHELTHFFGASNSLRLHVSAHASADGVRVQVHKTPEADSATP